MVRVLFLHPDLGIGGAERLVVDAAVALKQRGHEVSFITNHYDEKHSFKEIGDYEFPVRVIGDWIPRSLFERFYAFFAYLRMLYAAFYVAFCLTHREKIDVIFCDLISIGIPILRLPRKRPKIIYYCHFPDQLLSKPEGYLKRIYRAPLNYLEELTVGMADVTLVNSKFTLKVFANTFRKLNVVPQVLYPSLNTLYIDKMELKARHAAITEPLPGDVPRNAFIFLDINRYERKKNHQLAVMGFKQLSKLLPLEDFQCCRLVIAGGYDTRVPENVEHYQELCTLVEQLELANSVTLLRSLSDDDKFALLHAASCLLYTPSNEHFGIVPLEGMYMKTPVIAVNSGGPKETILSSLTGLLVEPNQTEFASAMQHLYQDSKLCQRMGIMGRKRVEKSFSFQAFGEKLDNIIMLIMAKDEGVKLH